VNEVSVGGIASFSSTVPPRFTAAALKKSR
jgi:hypothetical protein